MWGNPAHTADYNRYSYAWNNPLMYMDPSGYDEEGEINNVYSLGGFDVLGDKTREEEHNGKKYIIRTFGDGSESVSLKGPEIVEKRTAPLAMQGAGYNNNSYFYRPKNDDSGIRDAQNGGQGAQSNEGWDATNTTLNAYGFASGIKEAIIEGGVALNRGINITKVNSISLLRTYGATGAKYLKISKGLGIAGSVVTTGYAVGQTINQYNSGGMKAVFKKRDVFDATVGMTGLGFAAYGIFVASNPIGWGVGAAVLIYGGTTTIWDVTHPQK